MKQYLLCLNKKMFIAIASPLWKKSIRKYGAEVMKVWSMLLI